VAGGLRVSRSWCHKDLVPARQPDLFAARGFLVADERQVVRVPVWAAVPAGRRRVPCPAGSTTRPPRTGPGRRDDDRGEGLHGPGSLLAVWSRPGISVFPARAGAALSYPQGVRASASVGRLRPRAGTTQRQTRAPHGPAARADWLTAVSGHVHEPAERGRKRHGIRQPARQRPAR
jgi:hypothetical protein